MRGLLPIGGSALVLLTIADLYMTVLYPRGNRGVVSVPLSRGLWCLFRSIAQQFPRWREHLLSFAGATLLVTTVAVWVSLSVFGFALIYYPVLGTDIQMQEGSTPTDFITALYYSGYAFATLGTGDITPQTGLQRMLMVLETILGFSILTLTLTYFSSVYSQLIQRNAFGLSLHHRTGGTADAAELLAHLSTDGSFDSSTRQDLAAIAQTCLVLLESHHSYPALGYFRFQEDYYALARITFLVMDTVTLCKTALHPQTHRSLLHSAALIELERSGTQWLTELAHKFVPHHRTAPALPPESLWRDRFDRAVARLKAEDIDTVPDWDAGADRYVALRRQWQPLVGAIASYMDDDWFAVAPADAAAASARFTDWAKRLD